MPQQPLAMSEIAYAQYKGRQARWIIEIQEDDGQLRGYASWADDSEVVATCEGLKVSDCVAGVAAALSAVTARLDLARSLDRALEDDDEPSD
jgi:hypothetical protein